MKKGQRKGFQNQKLKSKADEYQEFFKTKLQIKLLNSF